VGEDESRFSAPTNWLAAGTDDETRATKNNGRIDNRSLARIAQAILSAGDGSEKPIIAYPTLEYQVQKSQSTFCRP
jgi:hypothetical protein